MTYMITSTITRPSRASIINPITTCEKRVSFLDDIDIAPLVKPKARIVTLEPIVRRSRTRSRRRVPEGIPEGSATDSQFFTQTHAQSHLQSESHHHPSHLQSQAQAQARAHSASVSQASTPSATPTPALAQQSQCMPRIATPEGPGRTRTLDSNSAQTDLSEPPRSPGPSENSFDTTPSSGGVPSAAESVVYTQTIKTGEPNRLAHRTASQNPHRKPITTSVEISSAGFLRGDVIEIKVQISHTKHIKSLHGVIATLYRQARVDMHPALPLVTEKDDELYPKSRTGLSGLSLSSTGSCHLYRKDFDQSFASIIINPETLTAEIKTSLRVPEDAFPTISTVPGAMISFKYYVEVILDIQGKLTALDKFLPTPNISTVSSALRNSQGMGTSGGAHANMYTGWGGHFIDTVDIKREKSVVSCAFEIVIGSRDSRRVGSWRDPITSTVGAEATLPAAASLGAPALPNGVTFAQTVNRLESLPLDSPSTPRPQSGLQETLHSSGSRHPQVPNRNATAPLANALYASESAPGYELSSPRLLSFQIPEESFESGLTEKERLRRAEERLFPSRPPDMSGESSTSNVIDTHFPTAPSAPDLVPLHHRNSGTSSHFHQSSAFGSVHATSQNPTDFTVVPTTINHFAPTYDFSQPFIGPSSMTSGDKQDMERRRLQAQRSAPAIGNGSGVASSFETTSQSPGHDQFNVPPVQHEIREYAPSAPVFTDEEVLGFHEYTAHSDLPRYER